MAGDPFSLLGLIPTFDLDPGDLERRYLERVGDLHPDRASRTQPSDPAADAAELNDARAVLADPERRASALLARLGGPPAEREKSLPPDFLAEILDVREQADEAIASRDPAQLARWRGWCRQRRDGIIRQVSAAFAALPSPPPAAPLAGIRRTLNAWRYIERLGERLED